MDEVFPDIYRIPLPLPRNPLRAINAYLIRGADRCLMVDTGMNRPECLEVMREALRALAIDRDRVDVFVTHGHSDHVGLVSEFNGAQSKIYLHPADTAIVYNPRLWTALAEAARTNGFPDAETAVGKHPGRKYLFSGAPEFTAVREGDALAVGRYRFRCVETPGHTPGHTCLYEPEAQMLFSGDHVLDSITPNISGWAANANPVGDFLQSLDKIAAYAVKLVLPGHRNPIADLRRRVDELKEHHQTRAAEIVGILDGQGQTAYQVASRMRWSLSYARWEDFPTPQQWFATGEALAHLVYLERTGRTTRAWRDGIAHFSRT